MAEVDFRYLSAELYRTPGERAVRRRLESIPGFAKALAVLVDSALLQAERQADTASHVRVGPGVYPALAAVWNTVQQRFGMNGIVLHIAPDLPAGSTLRGGNANPRVILSESLLASLPEREMTALLAMHAGSLRLGQATLIAACDFSRRFMDFYGIAGAPAVLPAWGLELWRAQAQCSADRAAALALGSPDDILAFLARNAGAGLDAWGGLTRPDDLRLQGLEALALTSDWSTTHLRRFALTMQRRNTAALIRRTGLLDWFASGRPAGILAGDITEPEEEATAAAAGPVPEDADPSLAFWGEFAGRPQSGDGKTAAADDALGSAMQGIRDTAGKGVAAFVKAGETFWNAFLEK